MCVPPPKGEGGGGRGNRRGSTGWPSSMAGPEIVIDTARGVCVGGDAVGQTSGLGETDADRCSGDGANSPGDLIGRWREQK